MKKSNQNAIYDHLRAQDLAKQQMKERALEADQEPVSAELISTEYYQNPLRAFGRAAVGDWLGGFLGSVLGAATTPGKDLATFRVRYATGRIGKETVEVDGKRFYELVAVLRD